MQKFFIAFFDFIINLMATIGQVSVVGFQVGVAALFAAPVMASLAAGCAILSQQVAPEVAFHAALDSIGTVALLFAGGSFVVGLLSVLLLFCAGLLYNLSSATEQ